MIKNDSLLNIAPKLLYLANCGVMADFHGTRILVDGLMDTFTQFDRLSPQQEACLLRGKPPYDSIDYLLFTHLHPDHFDISKAMRYMTMHPETRLILPLNGQLAQRPTAKQDRQSTQRSTIRQDSLISEKLSASFGDRVIYLSDEQGQICLCPSRKLFLDYIKTKHIGVSAPSRSEIPDHGESASSAKQGIEPLAQQKIKSSAQREKASLTQQEATSPVKQEADSPAHYCFMLSQGIYKVIFTADMDMCELPRLTSAFAIARRCSDLAALSSECPTHVIAFFNPFLLGRQKWADVISAWAAETVFLYHIPSSEKDLHGYRSLALRRLSRYQATLPELNLLTEPFISLL